MPCGICGYVGEGDSKLLGSMCSVLEHRGPDDEGKFIDEGIGLAARRLAIMDPEAGRQPMTNEDGTVWVVQNGEIYNYVELREELEKLGHRFRTNCDTEVIAHSFEQWKTGCFQHFVGMFAIALWDTQQRILVLARDRFGKKPLFYSLQNHSFLFGSEIKSILESRDVERRVNHLSLRAYLSLFYVPCPNTIFENIFSLEPGQFLVYGNGEICRQEYWDIHIAEALHYPESYLIERLHALLSDSIRVRLRSDVPLGFFLSGGIDSSVVVAMASKMVQPLSTFTIAFEQQSYDESRWAREVAEHCGTQHHEFRVDSDALGILPKLAWHLDQPFADSSIIPTYYVSHAAHDCVKVVLSGDGGDEMFMGYPWFLDPFPYKYWSASPRVLRTLATSLVSRLPFDEHVARYANYSRELEETGKTEFDRYSIRVTHFREGEISSLLNERPNPKGSLSRTNQYLKSVGAKSRSSDYLSVIDYVTIKTYMADDILVKVDRMSMANSLEVRCPMLDHRVAEFLASVSPRMKVRQGNLKYILKQMAGKYELLPQDVVRRKKHGFSVPLESWFRNEWRDASEQLIQQSVSSTGFGSLVNSSFVDRILSKPSANASKVFALVMLALWYRMYIEGPEKPSLNITTYL